MKKLKVAAVACGAIVAVGVGAPAFADEAPAPQTAPVTGTVADGEDAQIAALDAESVRKEAAQREAILNQDREGLLTLTAKPLTKTEDSEWYKKQMKEDAEAELRPSPGSADEKFNAWIKERDARMRQSIVGLSDSQTLGLNPFRPGY
ncbi:hypothetical protein C3486_25955 [Streptomyces sp. Ru73]|uniref:hypothetical protein n=1 Tax=Streptomyces sp. Ru73 TaxID=2080748 RepID=UPI000CDE2287|nr:hypothetical protein [Streptomyces sp. Ru73]POX37870.1 hypothetical protein C3486_25955 [Streptomyces sp. Ru73]